MSRLKELKEEYGCIGIKMETEGAENSFEEIIIMRRLTMGTLPLIVKIGGPNARNDIRTLVTIVGVDGIIAPMIESPYGVKDYVEALKSCCGERFDEILKGMNVETITAAKNIDEMLALEEIKYLQQITIGRSDLSRSMGLKVDDEEVMNLVAEVTRKSQDKGLVVSVGGGITPKNAKMIIEKAKPNKINTRHVVFDARTPNISDAVEKGLEFEIAWLKYLSKRLLEQRDKVERRISEIERRMKEK